MQRVGKAEGTNRLPRAAEGRFLRGARSDLGVCSVGSWLSRGQTPHILGRHGIASKGRQMLESLSHAEFEVERKMSQLWFILNGHR